MTITYCPHDMQIINGKSTCSICLRQPDVPLIDDEPAAGRKNRAAAYTEYRRGQAKNEPGYCARCDAPLNTDAVWSPVDGGLIGACCEDEAA